VVVHEVGRALAEVELVGDAEGRHRRHARHLGVGAAERRQRGDAIAGREARLRRSLADDAGQLAAERERRIELELVLAARLKQLGEGDASRLDVDEQVAVARLRLVDLDQPDGRRAGQLGDLDGPHERTARLASV